MRNWKNCRKMKHFWKLYFYFIYNIDIFQNSNNVQKIFCVIKVFVCQFVHQSFKVFFLFSVTLRRGGVGEKKGCVCVYVIDDQ